MFTENEQMHKLVLKKLSPTDLEHIAKTKRPNEHVARVYPASQTKQKLRSATIKTK
jgi:hypothetical protein